MTKDMTDGKPLKLILQFAIPLILGGLLQQLYSIVDTIVVGRLISAQALAAVGSTGAIHSFIFGFCSAMCEGFAIPVAQQFGARNYGSMRRFIANSIWLCFILSVSITTASVLSCRTVLTVMNTPEDIFSDAYLYLIVCLAGIPATIFYNILAGIIRALGDSKTPLIILIISSLINIVLDIVLVAFFHFGVEGTAYATVAAQLVSVLCCFFFMKKKYEVLHMEKAEMKFDRHYALLLLGVGIPMGLQCSITYFGSIILQTAINSLGTIYISAIAAGSRVLNIFMSPLCSISSTMATFGGQNVGAGKIHRIGEGLRICLLISAIYSVLSLLIFIFFAPQLISLFVNQSETDLINHARTYLIANASFYFAVSLLMTLRSLVQSLGFSHYAVFCGLFELIARLVIAWIFIPAFGYIAVCFSNPLAWVLAGGFLIPVYRYCIKKLKNQVGKSTSASSIPQS